MRGYQTPQKEHARASDPANRKLKKFQKIPTKSLSAAFTSAFEDSSAEDLKEPAYSSSFSEVSEVDMNGELKESFKLVPDPPLSASSGSWLLSDVTPFSVVTTDKDEPPGLVSLNHGGFNAVDGSNSGSLEAEIAVGVLRRARTEVSNFADMDSRSKKLLDALIEIVIQDLNTLPPQGDQFADLLSAKTRILFLCSLLWILVLAVILFSSSGALGPSTRPLPT